MQAGKGKQARREGQQAGKGRQAREAGRRGQGVRQAKAGRQASRHREGGAVKQKRVGRIEQTGELARAVSRQANNKTR
jgi:hypothetical protein